MIVRITFLDKKNNKIIMLFGNSYKTWEMQYTEYLRWVCHKFETYSLCRYTGIADIEISNESWMRWGGLKWCKVEDFQEELNREGCLNEGDCDNPYPRRYDAMKFYENKKISAKAVKIFHSMVEIITKTV